MNKNSETSRFVGWLWRGLRNMIGNMTGLSAKSRSEKERKLGAFLLLSQVVWTALPISPFKIALIISQVLLGFVLMLHGDYLKSLESAEERKTWKLEMREFHIEYIAERDGISLEEATKKADETDWRDQEGKRVPPPWVDKEKEKVNDDL